MCVCEKAGVRPSFTSSVIAYCIGCVPMEMLWAQKSDGALQKGVGFMTALTNETSLHQ